jgi:hypothetical protein
MSAEHGSKWKVVLRALMTYDKERMVEVISRISTAASSILRSSRDQDRLFNVRRLALCIISCDVDQFAGHITSIKEKIAELGRTVSIDPIHGEEYLLFRALLLRISPSHLTAIWPLMMTQITTLFTMILEQSGAVSKEQLPLFFGACKFLDTMLVVNSEDFQLYLSPDSTLIMQARVGLYNRHN